MNEVPKPGRNGKPQQAIILSETGFNAGLVMNHGSSGSQKQCRSFSNEKSRHLNKQTFKNSL
jgi:hypothetical protein